MCVCLCVSVLVRVCPVFFCGWEVDGVADGKGVPITSFFHLFIYFADAPNALPKSLNEHPANKRALNRQTVT